MDTSRSYYQRTAADDKSIGFEYQYYYFLYLLLNLKYNESIGLEIKDDIHIEKPDNTLILLQLKHSTQTAANGNIINLRERDLDLWKTLYNWINVIKDKNDGRADKISQHAFIKNTEFVLVSNKSYTDSNKILIKLSGLKEDRISISDFKCFMKEFKADTKESESNSDLLIYIDTLISQDDELLKGFIKKITFELNQDNLIEKIRQVIQYEKHVDEKRVDDVFHKLDSTLREDNYISIKKRNKIIISSEEFNKRYRICFESQRNNRLPIRRSRILLPDKLEEQTFIKQLIDIGDIDKHSSDEMIEYTIHKILIENNIKLWIQNGELTSEQNNIFHKNAVLRWKNCFKTEYDDAEDIISDEECSKDQVLKKINKIARKCVNKLRGTELFIDNEKLEIDLSNGEFYSLSDIPEIGWTKGWEVKYKKND